MGAVNGSNSGHGAAGEDVTSAATEAAPPPSELLRADLRELGPFPGEHAATVRYQPGPELERQLTAALASSVESLVPLVAGGQHVGREEALLARRQKLIVAIATGSGAPAAEIVPFASLATLFSVLASGFPRARDRQPASMMVAAPARPLYKWAARAAGVKVVEVPLDAELRPDLAMMTRALGALRPSVIVVGAPHDGTGIAPEPAALEKLLLATRGDALVVLDETFAPPGSSRRTLRAVAPHLAIVRSLEAWLAPDLAFSWLEVAPDVARVLETFPSVARPELSAASVAVGEVLLGDPGRGLFAADVEQLHAVHDRLRARLAKLSFVHPLDARAPFVAVVHDDPVASLLAEVTRLGLPGISGGGVGRLARLSRIAVASDTEAERVVAVYARARSLLSSNEAP